MLMILSSAEAASVYRPRTVLRRAHGPRFLDDSTSPPGCGRRPGHVAAWALLTDHYGICLAFATIADKNALTNFERGTEDPPRAVHQQCRRHGISPTDPSSELGVF